MLTRSVLVSFVTLLLVSPSALANDAERLVGNWKLLSFFTEHVQTKQRVNLFGEQPTGAIAFTPAGRFFAIITAEGRKVPQTTEERAAAYGTMVAYTGKWRLEGDSLITKVDVAWNPAWVGTDQVRFWRLEGNKLFAITPPIPNPNVAGGVVTVTAVWEKEP
jgi:lipocalin-like protein